MIDTAYIVGGLLVGIIAAVIWILDRKGLIDKDALISDAFRNLENILDDVILVNKIKDYDLKHGTNYLTQLKTFLAEMEDAMTSAPLPKYIKIATKIIPEVANIIKIVGIIKV